MTLILDDLKKLLRTVLYQLCVIVAKWYTAEGRRWYRRMGW